MSICTDRECTNLYEVFSNLSFYKYFRCCRAHDFCPFDLPGLTKSNPAPYTMVGVYKIFLTTLFCRDSILTEIGL